MYEFKYVRPNSVRQAANMLAKDPDAKILAGGHSLLPAMKLRLAKHTQLLDIGRIEGINTIELKGRSLVIGAMARHVEVANSPVVKEALPVLAKLAGEIGDPAVRHRGTIGGSLANNDPNADYPAAVLGLGATVITNKRKIAADDFFKGMFETALEPDEIIVKVSFPLAKKSAYMKFKHPASGFALVGVLVSKRGGHPRRRDRAGSNGVFREELRGALKKRFSRSRSRA
jgi:carbon-monoxide dehydrogenase medium subunit